MGAEKARACLGARYRLPCAMLQLLYVLVAANAAAQPYPARPITVLIGNPPGNATDIMARTMTEEVKSSLKQNFVMINRPGANGSIAVESFRRARPDGYTLLFEIGRAHV